MKKREEKRAMFFEIFGWVFGLIMVIGMLFITVYVVQTHTNDQIIITKARHIPYLFIVF